MVRLGLGLRPEKISATAIFWREGVAAGVWSRCPGATCPTFSFISCCFLLSDVTDFTCPSETRHQSLASVSVLQSSLCVPSHYGLSVLRQEIRWEERLRNDLFCVEWDEKLWPRESSPRSCPWTRKFSLCRVLGKT